MARRIKTYKYVQYVERSTDIRAVQDYYETMPDNLAAAYTSIDDSYHVALVLDTAEQNILHETNLSEHPLAREGETRLSALTAAHQAYLGSLSIEQNIRAI